MESEQDQIKRLEETGVERVRIMVSNGGYPPSPGLAVQWLGKKDTEAREKSDVIQAQMASAAQESAAAAVRSADAAEAQARIARQALTAAYVADAIAILALVIGIISILRSH